MNKNYQVVTLIALSLCTFNSNHPMYSRVWETIKRSLYNPPKARQATQQLLQRREELKKKRNQEMGEFAQLSEENQEKSFYHFLNQYPEGSSNVGIPNQILLTTSDSGNFLEVRTNDHEIIRVPLSHRLITSCNHDKLADQIPASKEQFNRLLNIIDNLKNRSYMRQLSLEQITEALDISYQLGCPADVIEAISTVAGIPWPKNKDEEKEYYFIETEDRHKGAFPKTSALFQSDYFKAAFALHWGSARGSYNRPFLLSHDEKTTIIPTIESIYDLTDFLHDTIDLHTLSIQRLIRLLPLTNYYGIYYYDQPTTVFNRKISKLFKAIRKKIKKYPMYEDLFMKISFIEKYQQAFVNKNYFFPDIYIGKKYIIENSENDEDSSYYPKVWFDLDNKDPEKLIGIGQYTGEEPYHMWTYDTNTLERAERIIPILDDYYKIHLMTPQLECLCINKHTGYLSLIDIRSGSLLWTQNKIHVKEKKMVEYILAALSYDNKSFILINSGPSKPSIYIINGKTGSIKFSFSHDKIARYYNIFNFNSEKISLFFYKTGIIQFLNLTGKIIFEKKICKGLLDLPQGRLTNKVAINPNLQNFVTISSSEITLYRDNGDMMHNNNIEELNVQISKYGFDLHPDNIKQLTESDPLILYSGSTKHICIIHRAENKIHIFNEKLIPIKTIVFEGNNLQKMNHCQLIGSDKNSLLITFGEEFGQAIILKNIKSLFNETEKVMVIDIDNLGTDYLVF